MCIYVVSYINTEFVVSFLFLFLTISPVYIIFLIYFEYKQQQQTPMSSDDSRIELSTSPSRKNFQERRAIHQFSAVPYK